MKGCRRRETVEIVCFFVLVWITKACSRKEDNEPFAPEFSFFESEEGILFFSDDEEQERVIAALSNEPMSSSLYDDEDDEDERTHEKDENHDTERSLAPNIKTRKPQRRITSDAKFNVADPPKLVPNYEYLQLPDMYRVNVTTMKYAQTIRPKQHLKQPRSVNEAHHPSGDHAQASPWVQRFLLQHPNDVLLPVPRDFCTDNFNLMHIAPAIERIGTQCLSSDDSVPPSSKPYPIYREALRLIVQDEPLPEDVPLYLKKAATALYVLIHQRFAVSPRGLDMLRRRFLLPGSGIHPVFGRCPRIQCSGMPLLPYGDSDNLNPMEYYYSWPQKRASVQHQQEEEDPLFFTSRMTRRSKRYCASCGEIFYHWSSEIDGCAWGTSCCHLFLMLFGKEIFGDWLGWKTHSPNSNPNSVGRIFGFRLHPSAHASNTQTWH